MPQLNIETYFSQYFWLVVLFFYLYLQMVNWAIPKIAQIIKTRREVANGGSVSSVDSGLINNQNTTLGYVVTRKLPSLAHPSIAEAATQWSHKKLK